MIGRKLELQKISACIASQRSVLLEGPVGVGKTHLALAATQSRGGTFFRIDGDSRYTEQKLTGWFDPPSVLKKGYVAESFIDGPLVEAMKAGGILFINELNRLPEGVQNILLPAIDEKIVHLPRLGIVTAQPGFVVIATQNPKEFVATSHLSEAILDRFELIHIDYQSEAEEVAIVLEKIGTPQDAQWIAEKSVALVSATRNHLRIKRGASVRAAIATAELTLALLKSFPKIETAFETAALMALPTRIEINRESELHQSHHHAVEEVIRELLKIVFEKKK
jgi:MoxR-like ATPase